MIFKEQFFNGSTLLIGISTVKDGSMKDKSNFTAFLRGLHVDPRTTATMNQIHSSDILPVDGKFNASSCDGLYTSKTNTALTVKTADCFPVILYDPSRLLIVLLHCGFKGIFEGIVDNAILKMKSLGVRSNDVHAFIGPGICAQCYTVPKERLTQFREKIHSNGIGYEDTLGSHLDLRAVIGTILRNYGVKSRHMRQLDYCTKEDIRFFSFRRDGSKAGRFVTVAYIR